jgi:hypothetical protein
MSMFGTAHQFALQQVALPCMRYLQQLMAPAPPTPVSTAPEADQAKDKVTSILY